jgi:hypothetical protein
VIRFKEHPPYNSAYVRILGAEATVRMFVFFQEDGGLNNGGSAQSPFSRKLVVNGTRRDVSIYMLNGEHGSSTAYSEVFRLNTYRCLQLTCSSSPLPPSNSLSIRAMSVCMAARGTI